MFLHNGLMEYGSVFGHGAYLGPDYTADYLRRSADLVLESSGASDEAARKTIEDFRTNRYDDRLGHASVQRAAGGRVPRARLLLQRLLLGADDRARAAADAITDETQLKQLTGVLRLDRLGRGRGRPGHDYSYTNNWPSEPRVDNTPTANVIVWSVCR